MFCFVCFQEGSIADVTPQAYESETEDNGDKVYQLLEEDSIRGQRRPGVSAPGGGLHPRTTATRCISSWRRTPSEDNGDPAYQFLEEDSIQEKNKLYEQRIVVHR